MLIQRYPRGNGFGWTASFTDVDGEPAQPDSVTLYVSYIDAGGERVRVPIEMDSDTDGLVWDAVWDSSVSKKCRVAVSVRAVNPPAAADEEFDLTSNLANPDPEEEST